MAIKDRITETFYYNEGTEKEPDLGYISGSAAEIPPKRLKQAITKDEYDRLSKFVADRDAQASAGTSTDYARADHNHPIVRQARPTDPVPAYSGGGSMTQNIVTDFWSDEESIEYAWRARVVTSAAGWDFITIPNLAGFQRPIITIEGTYRQTGNPNEDNGARGAMPDAPYMGQEAAHWSSTQRIYIGQFNDKPTASTMFVMYRAKYIRL